MRVGSVLSAVSVACSVIVACISGMIRNECKSCIIIIIIIRSVFGNRIPRSHAVRMKRQLRGPNLGDMNVVRARTRLEVVVLAVHMSVIPQCQSENSP